MSTTITCAACGTDFAFSQEEQEFYESKGFQSPRKCKPCRDAAKASRGGGYGGGSRGGYSGGGYSRPQRQMYDAVCYGCGVNTQVPFEPNGSKPVYCRDCFQTSRAY
jgi:CxxC-x17-CxxC domain-containing protein